MKHINDLYSGILYESIFITFVFLVIFVLSAMFFVKYHYRYKKSTGFEKISNEFNKNMSGLACGLSLIGLGTGIIFCFNVSTWFI